MTEFSRIFRVDQIGVEGLSFEIHVTDQERVSLARRLGVTEVRSLSAHGRIQLFSRGVEVEGSFEGCVIMPCAVTLEPLEIKLREPFEVLYVRELTPFQPHAVDEDGNAALSLEDLAEDEEVFDGDVFDVGESVVQYLILALPVAPKATGMSPGAEDWVEYDSSAKENKPLAGLGILRKK